MVDEKEIRNEVLEEQENIEIIPVINLNLHFVDEVDSKIGWMGEKLVTKSAPCSPNVRVNSYLRAVRSQGGVTSAGFRRGKTSNLEIRTSNSSAGIVT